ncbi:hypothetical protein GGR51DRAFT_544266 [Nemania sp. FL0031]|nr:hypothetical protein GGR51DRAFT_544266 [Nemania sp. FL0031]
MGLMVEVAVPVVLGGIVPIEIETLVSVIVSVVPDTSVVMVVRKGVLTVYQVVTLSVIVVVDAKLQLGLSPFSAAATPARTAAIMVFIAKDWKEDRYYDRCD